MEEMLVFMERRERCICSAYFLIKEQGMQQSQPVLVLRSSSGWPSKAYFTKGSCCFIRLQVLDLLHSRYLLLLPTPINSATVIHHMIPFLGDTTPSTSIFALAVCWSLNSIHFFLLAPFHNNNDKKK